MNRELFPKNAFHGILNNEPLGMSEVEFKIKQGDLEGARKLLNEKNLSDNDPTKIFYLQKISKELSLVPEENTVIVGGAYDGTDITPYLIIEEKIKTGEATEAEFADFLSFWHSYPVERQEYSVDIFRLQLHYRNYRHMNPNLLTILIARESRPEIKYFYILFSYYNGYIDSFELRQERRRISPDSRAKGKKMYFEFSENNSLSNLLEDNLG
jgi:hypothetical protein